jgi:hypothetical protein
MQIADLSYLEDVSEQTFLAGGALVAVDAKATGTSTFTDAVTKAKTFKNGISIAFGFGRAIATGGNPMAGVFVYGEGDKVIEKTKTKYFENKDTVVSRGFVIAIDYP